MCVGVQSHSSSCSTKIKRDAIPIQGSNSEFVFCLKGVINFVFKESLFTQDQATKDKVLQSMASMSSAQIVSAGTLQNEPLNPIRSPYSNQLWGGLPPQEQE